MVFIFFWSDVLNTRRSVLSHILTPRSKISNTRKSVLSDIQTPRSKILNTMGVFRLIYKHWEVIIKKREGVSHPIPNHCKRKQHCWMLHDASVCTPSSVLLCVSGSYCTKFKTVQTFSYVQTDATTPNNVASVCTGL